MMFYYELRKWLLKVRRESDDKNPDIVTEQVEHIRKMIEMREYPQLVAMDLLRASIELSHIHGGADEMLAFADHMTGMAESLRVRVKRGRIRTVPKSTDPINQA